MLSNQKGKSNSEMMTADLDLTIIYLGWGRLFHCRKVFGGPFLFKCDQQRYNITVLLITELMGFKFYLNTLIHFNSNSMLKTYIIYFLVGFIQTVLRRDVFVEATSCSGHYQVESRIQF